MTWRSRTLHQNLMNYVYDLGLSSLSIAYLGAPSIHAGFSGVLLAHVLFVDTPKYGKQTIDSTLSSAGGLLRRGALLLAHRLIILFSWAPRKMGLRRRTRPRCSLASMSCLFAFGWRPLPLHPCPPGRSDGQADRLSGPGRAPLPELLAALPSRAFFG